MFVPDVNSRIASLTKEIHSISGEVQDEATRKQLLGVIMEAMSKVETPMETIWRMIMSPHGPAALMVVIRMGIVTELAQSDEAKTAKELSETCKGDEMLIVRLMRPLVALGIFKEVDVQTYQSTEISKMLTAPPLIGGYQFMFDMATRSLSNLPRYLERTGFKHVNGPPGPFQDSNNTEDLMWPYLIKNPEMLGNFNAFMSGSIATRPNWFDAFPAEDIVLKGAKNEHDAVLFVDIAGGHGHDTAAFHRAFPSAPGKLVLQDLPPVIESITSLDEAIIRQSYDFFEPQPIKRARAYYMRSIFHDWPDDACVKIMKQIADAMERGYSKLLIFEWILPAKGVPLYPALLDINMMALLNGKERTESEWLKLLKEAGLKVVKFHQAGPEAEGLIEAVLAD